LVIDDSAIATLHIGGAFDATDLDSFLAALQSFGIRAVPAEPNAGDPASEIIRLTGPEVKQ
jgi:ferric-dicitrate binding protein FerR (iron transport regulator)